jgi:hypothetical protein
MKLLAEHKISTSLHYHSERNQYYLDLETRAESDLHLYDDGIILGRYNYEQSIDLSEDSESIIRSLCYEFENALHGRNYCQESWLELCKSKGITVKFSSLYS